MDSKDALVVFEGAKIRRTWHDDQWFFSVVDIIQILTDSGSPRQYWGVLKKRDTQLLTICLQLKLPSADGKTRVINSLLKKISHSKRDVFSCTKKTYDCKRHCHLLPLFHPPLFSSTPGHTASPITSASTNTLPVFN